MHRVLSQLTLFFLSLISLSLLVSQDAMHACIHDTKSSQVLGRDTMIKEGVLGEGKHSDKEKKNQKSKQNKGGEKMPAAGVLARGEEGMIIPLFFFFFFGSVHLALLRSSCPSLTLCIDKKVHFVVDLLSIYLLRPFFVLVPPFAY